MSPRPGPFSDVRHSAGFYRDTGDLLTQVAPLVSDALDRGDAVAIALDQQTDDALCAVLGPLPDVLRLPHPQSTVGLSGQTEATLRARQFDELSGGFRPITAIIKHDSRFDGPDGRFWTELDAASNLALARIPVTLTCFFPRSSPHTSLLAGARHNHPLLFQDGSAHPNAAFRPACQVLTRIPVPAPLPLGEPVAAFDLADIPLASVRDITTRAMLRHEYAASKVSEAVLAINEVVTNAVQHGRQPIRLHVWDTSDGCVFEVHDRGRLVDPLPGLNQPDPDSMRGWGLWIARQVTDYLHLWSDDAGTHVRIAMWHTTAPQAPDAEAPQCPSATVVRATHRR